MTTLRRTVTGTIALLLVAVPLVLLGSPSRGDASRLLVSSSAGGPFREHLSRPLFARGGPFVPRDAATRTFYVKNATPGVARVTLSVVDRGATSTFESALTFDVRIGGTPSPAALPGAADDPSCAPVTSGPDIAPGEVQAVEVSLAVADLNGTRGTGQQASLDLVVTLSDAEPGGAVAGCEGPAPAERADDCDRVAVVSVADRPECVPHVVDAGRHDGEDTRPLEPAASVAALLLTLGAAMALWGGRRRKAGPPAIPA